MAIADIQIAPPVLNLDAATRQGQFRVQVANQLGRDGRLQVSLIPVGDTKPEWLRLDEKFRCDGQPDVVVRSDHPGEARVQLTRRRRWR